MVFDPVLAPGESLVHVPQKTLHGGVFWNI